MALAVLPADDLLPALLVHVDGSPVIVDYAVRGRGRVGEVEERRARIDRNPLHGLLDLDYVLELVLVEADEVEAHAAPVGDAPRNLEAGVLDVGEFVQAHEDHAVRIDVENGPASRALGLLAGDFCLAEFKRLLGGKPLIPHDIRRARIFRKDIGNIAIHIEMRAARKNERIVAVRIGLERPAMRNEVAHARIRAGDRLVVGTREETHKYRLLRTRNRRRLEAHDRQRRRTRSDHVRVKFAAAGWRHLNRVRGASVVLDRVQHFAARLHAFLRGSRENSGNHFGRRDLLLELNERTALRGPFVDTPARRRIHLRNSGERQHIVAIEAVRLVDLRLEDDVDREMRVFKRLDERVEKTVVAAAVRECMTLIRLREEDCHLARNAAVARSEKFVHVLYLALGEAYSNELVGADLVGAEEVVGAHFADFFQRLLGPHPPELKALPLALGLDYFVHHTPVARTARPLEHIGDVVPPLVLVKEALADRVRGRADVHLRVDDRLTVRERAEKMRLDRAAVSARRRADDFEVAVRLVEVDAARTHGGRLEARERIWVDFAERLLTLLQKRRELLLYELDAVGALEILRGPPLLGAGGLVEELVAPGLPPHRYRILRAFGPHRLPDVAPFLGDDRIGHEVVPAGRLRLLVLEPQRAMAPGGRGEVHVERKSARDRAGVLFVVATTDLLVGVELVEPVHRRLVADAVEPEPLQVVVARHLLVEPLELRNVPGSVLVALELRRAVPDGRREVVRLAIYKKMPFLRDGERRVPRIKLVLGKSVKGYKRIEAEPLGIKVFVGRRNGSGQNN